MSGALPFCYGRSISSEFDKNINALKRKAEKYFNNFHCLCDSHVKQVNFGLYLIFKMIMLIFKRFFNKGIPRKAFCSFRGIPLRASCPLALGVLLEPDIGDIHRVVKPILHGALYNFVL